MEMSESQGWSRLNGGRGSLSFPSLRIISLLLLLLLLLLLYNIPQGPGVAQCLRRCVTSRKVPGLIPGGVIGFFSDILLPTAP
jgi:hypothetical protein